MNGVGDGVGVGASISVGPAIGQGMKGIKVEEVVA